MPLNIFKASAGSGKTFTLAKEFILACFKSKDSFQNILAVTFTNKASSEMRERILEKLENLAKNGANADYFLDIQNQYNYSEQIIKNKAKEILSEILHNYSYFTIKTIDSFVGKVVKSFGYDLHVNSQYKPTVDQEFVLNGLIKMLYQKISEDPQIEQKLLELSKNNIEQGSSWDISQKIKEYAQDLVFKEEFADFQKNLEIYQNSQDEFNSIKKFHKSKVEEYEKQIKEIYIKSQNYFSILEVCGQKPKYLCSFFKKLQDPYAITKEGINATVEKFAINGENPLAKAASKEVKDNFLPIENDCRILAQNAANLILNDSKDYLTSKLILKNYDNFLLLSNIANLLPEFRQENKLMLVSDSTQFLQEIIAGNDAPFIYEKIGNQYSNILIDEFQDTSEYQWNCFKPLVENSLSENNNSLIVGDIKQSIYRWRSGDWTLLHKTVDNQIGRQNIRTFNLDTNFRSRKNIIDFNNKIFEYFPKRLDEILEIKDKEYLGFEISKIYDDSFQKVPNNSKKIGGKVEVEFFEEKENLPTLANQIDELLKSKNFVPNDICILTRNNKESIEIIEYLFDYQNNNQDSFKYEIVSGDSLKISQSQAVMFLISAMKYIYSPKNIEAKTQMFLAYNALNNNPYTHDEIFVELNREKINPEYQISKEMMIENYDEILSKLSSYSLYDMVEKIIEIFDVAKNKGDHEYLRTFMDAVLDFTFNQSSDLSRFINYWDEKGNSIGIQSNQNSNSISIMTIHKSKGLDFRVVMIPFCNFKLDDTKKNQMWVAKPDYQMPYMPILYDSIMPKTRFEKEYYIEKANRFVDNINILYVALTRASEQMYIYCDMPKEEKNGGYKISTVGDLLYECILSQYPEKFDNQKLIIDNDYQAKPKESKKQNKENAKELGFFKSDWQDRLQIKMHASDFFVENNAFRQEKINYGLFMHKVFSMINTAEDIDQVIRELFYEDGKLDKNQAEQLRAKLKTAMLNPEIANWFSDKWEVKNETEIILKDGKRRIPDRFITDGKQTIVIDFKFGQDHKEQYDAQVNQYKEILSQMGYPNVKGALYFVDKNLVRWVE